MATPIVLRGQGFGDAFAESLLATFLQERQIQLQKEAQKLEERRLKLAEQEAAQRAQLLEAQGRAGQAVLGLMAQQDPQVQQTLQQLFPQATANLAALADANVPSAQVFGQPFDARRIAGPEAAAVAQQLQAFQQQQAQLELARAGVEQTRAQTEETRERTQLARVQTRTAELALEHARAIFPLEQQKLLTDIALAQAQIESIRAENRRAAARNINEMQQLFAQLAQWFGSPEEASRMVFGTTSPPSRDALLAEELSFLSDAVAVASGAPDPRSMLAQLYEDRFRSRIARNMNLSATDQAFIDGLIAQGMKPIDAYKEARKLAGKKNSPIVEQDLPAIAAYLRARFKDFRLPEKEVGFLRRLFQRLRASATQGFLSQPPIMSIGQGPLNLLQQWRETLQVGVPNIPSATTSLLPGRFGSFNAVQP